MDIEHLTKGKYPPTETKMIYNLKDKRQVMTVDAMVRNNGRPKRKVLSYQRSTIKKIEYYTTMKIVIWNHYDKEVQSFKEGMG